MNNQFISYVIEDHNVLACKSVCTLQIYCIYVWNMSDLLYLCMYHTYTIYIICERNSQHRCRTSKRPRREAHQLQPSSFPSVVQECVHTPDVLYLCMIYIRCIVFMYDIYLIYIKYAAKCLWLKAMGWLRLISSLKLQVSFAEYSLFYGALLQKRLVIVRSLLIVATSYDVLVCSGVCHTLSDWLYLGVMTMYLGVIHMKCVWYVWNVYHVHTLSDPNPMIRDGYGVAKQHMTRDSLSLQANYRKRAP